MKFGSFKDSRNRNPKRKKPLRSLQEFAKELGINLNQLVGYFNSSRIDRPEIVFRTHSSNVTKLKTEDSKLYSGYVSYYYYHELKAWWQANLKAMNEGFITEENDDGR